MELRERYFSVAEAEWPVHRTGNLRFYLDYLFEGIDLQGARVLDIGAGGGRYSFYAAAAGAARVVALEPEEAGSDTGVASQFEQVSDRLGVDSVELRHETLQEFDPGDELFDVFFMHASINHLDEPATMRLHTDEAARQVYRELFAKLAGMGADRAKLVASDATRHNLFAKLPVRNPLQPTIEWEKHQPPEAWIGRPLSVAGPSTVAANTSFRVGSRMTPTAGKPSTTSPIETQKTGSPLA